LAQRAWPTVEEAMLGSAKLHGRATTAAELRALFTDEHVHCALLVEAGRLVAVVGNDDLGSAPADALAACYGRLGGRVVYPGADLEATRLSMLGQGRRRLAVIDEDGMLLGLLCLKRSGLGFCTDCDVQARARERRQAGPAGRNRTCQPFGGLGARPADRRAFGARVQAFHRSRRDKSVARWEGGRPLLAGGENDKRDG
jgi:hypothetical protein